MSVRCLFFSAAVACLAPLASLVVPATASAAGLYIPSPFPDDTAPRPTYRERLKQFPPPGGRLGGGPLEYIQTGGRPVPVAPEYAQTVLPNFVKHPYARPGDRRADYGGVNGGPRRADPYARPVYAAQPVYAEPAYAQPVYAAPYQERAALPQGGLPPFLGSGAGDGSYAPPSDALTGYSGLAEPRPVPRATRAAPLPSYTALASTQQGPEPDPAVQPAFAWPDFSQPAFGDTTGSVRTAAPAQADLDPLGLGALFGGQQPLGGAGPVPTAPTRPGIDPMYQRQVVAYAGGERPGTVVIDTPDKFLYLVQGGGRALRYGIGVGRPGFTWAGVKTVSRKAEWPGWTPPREMLKRRPDLPRHMVGGEANPLGARALYLGSSMYRIHGTSEPDTIGTNVSSGCIRMTNADVTDLYERVPVGTKVIVR